MKFAKKLLAVVLAGVLALAMLTACSQTPEMPVEEARAEVLSGVNEALRRLGKPEVQEDEQLDRLAEQYLEALQRYGTNIYGTLLDREFGRLQGETNKLEINGEKVAFSARRSRTNGANPVPITDGSRYALDRIYSDMDYVGIAVGYADGEYHTVLWFAKRVY